jgi:hypothetical protein
MQYISIAIYLACEKCMIEIFFFALVLGYMINLENLLFDSSDSLE